MIKVWARRRPEHQGGYWDRRCEGAGYTPDDPLEATLRYLGDDEIYFSWSGVWDSERFDIFDKNPFNARLEEML